MLPAGAEVSVGNIYIYILVIKLISL
jgi:hypothetical protein